MLIVGWDKQGFTVLNSWGEGFGKKGLFTMPYNIVTWSQRNNFPLPLFEAWAIDGVYVDGKLLETGKEPVTPPTPAEGWYKQQGKWRYRENGKDVTGWKQVKGVWYYLQSDGYMKTGWLKDKGKWYFLKPWGGMATGWIKDKGEWYYLNSTGAMLEGWQKIGGRWYYFEPKVGKAARGFRTIAGKDYYFFEESFGNVKECQMLLTDGSGAVKV